MDAPDCVHVRVHLKLQPADPATEFGGRFFGFNAEVVEGQVSDSPALRCSLQEPAERLEIYGAISSLTSDLIQLPPDTKLDVF